MDHKSCSCAALNMACGLYSLYDLDVAVDGGDVVDVDNVHNNIQLSTPDDK